MQFGLGVGIPCLIMSSKYYRLHVLKSTGKMDEKCEWEIGKRNFGNDF